MPSQALAYVTTALSLYVILGQWSVFLHAYLRRRRSPSVVPFVGGLLGSFSIALLVGPTWLVVLPLVVDVGSLPSVACFVYDTWTRRNRREA